MYTHRSKYLICCSDKYIISSTYDQSRFKDVRKTTPRPAPRYVGILSGVPALVSSTQQDSHVYGNYPFTNTPADGATSG